MKLLKLPSIFVMTLLGLCAFLVSPAYASTSVSFSPSSGTVGKTFNVSVVVNTGSDEINGIDLDVTYEGNVTFTGSGAGNLGCTPTVNDDVDGVVGLICFIPPGDSFSGSGTLATLSFSASTNTSLVLGVENVDIAGSSEGTLGTATLTVDTTYTGGSTTDDTLPDTGIISDNIFLIVGGVFLLIGVGLSIMPESWNLMTLRKKSDASRKEKFEKKMISSAK